MERIFLDANVLWSAAFKEFSSLRRLWSLPDTKVLTSEYAVEEARRNLESYAGSETERKWLLKGLDALLADLEIVATPYPLPETLEANLPAKDLPILAAAVAAKAKFLITGDKRHFGAHFGRKIHGIAILRPADYLRRFGAQDE